MNVEPDPRVHQRGMQLGDRSIGTAACGTYATPATERAQPMSSLSRDYNTVTKFASHPLYKAVYIIN